MSGLLEKLFPKDEVRKPSSKLVERGLEALRLVRDEHAMMMGTVRRVPSHFELRLSPGKHEELVRMDALRDLEFHFKDELMKDLATEGSRTFGDHTIHVRIAPDPALGEKELYGMVLNPERRPSTTAPARENRGSGTPSDADATRVLEEEISEPVEDSGETATVIVGESEPVGPRYRLNLRFPDGTERREEPEGDRWIIGRRGHSGTPVPEGYRKVELDLPTTVSREQIRVEIEPDSLLVTNIGKGIVAFPDGTLLQGGDSRRMRPGDVLLLEGVGLSVVTVS